MRDYGHSIGLLAGSFNPAHDGHMHVALCGLNRLRLDRIWWMVTPQNPLKSHQPPYESRVQTVRDLGLRPRMEISHMERTFGTNFTVETLRRAQQRWPNARFVFLMGADNFAQLPKWKAWQEILHRVPIAVIGRPQSGIGYNIRPRLGQVARMYAQARIPEIAADQLQFAQTPAWCYLTPPLNSQSSTAIRRARSTGRDPS